MGFKVARNLKLPRDRTTVWLRLETRTLVRRHKQRGESMDTTIRRVFLNHEAAEKGKGQGYVRADVLAVLPPKRRTMNPRPYHIMLDIGKVYYLYHAGDFQEVKDLKQARRDLEKRFRK